MHPFRRLLHRLEGWAIPNLAFYLVIGQVAVLGLELLGGISSYPLWLIPDNVLAGEWWRVLTFILVPPNVSLIWIAFAWYLFWFMGGALESHWGTPRFNLFLLTGWALTVGASFLAPSAIGTNAFLGSSVFLAFAWLAPNFEIAIFFVLPVKIKWLALLTWLGFAYSFVAGGWSARLAVLAAAGNFLIFFGRDIWSALLQRWRAVDRDAGPMHASEGPGIHRCKVCGRSSETHPDLDFRYCSKCVDDSCYCSEHLRNHEHTVSGSAGQTGTE